MDNIRFVLVMAMLMISYMLWEAWQIDYGPKPRAIVSDKPIVAGDAGLSNVQQSPDAAQTPAGQPTAQAVAADRVVKVKTDVYELEIDVEGGTLRNLDLLNYPHEKTNTVVQKAWALIGLPAPEKNLAPIRLFDSNPENLFLAQTGLVANQNSSSAPDHHAVFSAERTDYTLADGQDQLIVPLTWTNEQGLRVVKTFTFSRGSYAVDVEQKIVNQSATAWSGRQYEQLLRVEHSDKSNNNFIRTYSGGVIYTDKEKFKKVKYEEMTEDNLAVSATGGWSGFIQHYFAAAWIPAADQENHYYTKALNDARYVIGSYSPDVNVQPNSEGSFKTKLFVGPKIQPVMEALAPGLELTVDYSWLTVIAKPIYWLLNEIHGYIGNWGLAIMGVTLFIKLLFFKLSKASYQSMAKMRKIQPRLKDLQERYADDRQRFNTEMMAMYKKEKVNPLGGCLPIMVQIPVFISLYWVLIETVELRQADFALWIQDLSAQDPFYLLPIVYGITMKIQQSLNPAPIDPLQAQVMKMFPIVFTVFFLFFPSGLVLYWICNNSLSILQQWYITKHVLEEDAHAH
ncbi:MULTISPECIES: membrane protein insertase YidC [Methylomonas]|uniref:Membrane protein insertase YidC n=1 Tax=Methylomonas koyamae TaxID=702114 RepID=A0A177P9C4_9GAMM|nr:MULTISPECIES: membrane protein insertase YidC [Methylomonas]NJA07377.1 membrane protein insertase YidC [Methylococcaceae bacterium WWC4]OAI26464.1 membrane protein insertase YidC [Methylomonas koyamae]WGS87314.1 membrane protein insertase YidC [Methylomonas sp. UP202]